ncbi:hypothetical protein [Marinovum algicola]|uniref:hypothetical protein n=1 Tax=Marinovum algicola TaxID=42444 RepID=UPI003B517408
MQQIRDIGALISCARVIANTSLTAAGSGDNTEVTGSIIDRYAIGTPQSAVLAIPFTAALDEDETLTISYTINDGAESDLGDEAELTTGSVVAATGPSGGGTVTGCVEIDLFIGGAGRYIRPDVTPDLSRGATDTAAISGIMVFGGADRLPQ